MKISSASKKVLASALSAAMVVAFAPTVAFGAIATGNTVNVKFDTTGLTVKDQNTALSADAYQLRATDTNELTLPSLVGHDYMFDANTPVAGWYLDLNGVAGYQGGADVAVDASDPTAPTLTSAEIVPGTTITLLPMKAAATVAITGMDTVKQKYAAGNAITFNVANSSTTASTGDLRVSLKKNGTEVAYQLLSDIAVSDDDDAVFTFVADTATTLAAGEIKVGTWGKGTWTVDAVTTGSQKVVASKTIEVTEMTIAGVFGTALGYTNSITAGQTQNGQSVLAVVGQNVGDQLKAAGAEIDVTASKVVKENGADTQVKAIAYKNATGTITSDTVIANFQKADGTYAKVTANMVLEAAYGDAAEVGTITFTPAVPSTSNDKLSATALYTVDGAEYTATLSGAASATKTATGNGGTVNFDLVDFGSAGAPAGTYTVTIAQTTDKGTNLEKTVTVGSTSITLTEVTVDEGEGSVNAGTKNQTTKAVKLSDTKLSAVIPVAAPTAKAGYRFVGWSLDGTNVVTGKETVGTSAITVKALWEASVVSAPTFAYGNGTLSLSNTAGDNYELYYVIGTAANETACNVKYTGPITLDVTKAANATVSFVAKRKAGVTTGEQYSKIIEITSYTLYADTIETWAKNLINVPTSDSTANAPKYYTAALPTAAADAKAAITALNYQDAKGWNAAILAQKTAVLQQVADYENGVIDALAAGIKNADGSKTLLDASVAAKQKAAVADVVTDYGLNNDYKADGVTLDTTTKSATAYTNDAAYVTAINKAAKDAAAVAITYAKADVEAAEAVTAQLKDPKTAAAGLEAYKGLTSTQKELVSAADLAAAEAAVAQAELVKAQDKAAAADGKAQVKGATYKIKAKGSKTIKIAKSASGAKVTLKQISGTKYAKVSDTKVTLKKAAKKGKKYTIKVKAVCGATTTSTVSFKVLVK